MGKGVLPTTSPKPVPLPRRKETALDKRGWTASASVPDGIYRFNDDPIDVSAARALDGDHWTGWRDLTQKQHSGQWFQVDMKQRQSFDKIVLDNTWALWDTPERYEVRVSDDGENWGDPVAVGRGELGITTITFPLRSARWIRITQTATNAKYNWSVYELDVYRGTR